MEKENIRKKTFLSSIAHRIEVWYTNWLLYEEKSDDPPLQDFEKMCQGLLPADVLLFEGKSRVSRAISVVSQSQWTHAALYIGRAKDLTKEAAMAKIIHDNYDGDADEQLVVESLLGKGMVITPLSEYANDSIRLCRPRGILAEDVQLVIKHTIMQLGREYDIRQLLDLARFIFPYPILPRRWLSSLFDYKTSRAKRIICSTVIAEAFMHVSFPIIPILRSVDQNITVTRRNPRLFTPRDFDYSPYFDVIKFPNVNYEQSFLWLRKKGGYRELPWDHDSSIYCNTMDECFYEEAEGVAKRPESEVKS